MSVNGFNLLEYKNLLFFAIHFLSTRAFIPSCRWLTLHTSF